MELALEQALRQASANDDQETLLARTLSTTSWWRVGLLLALLTLASAAFAAKRVPLRWAAITATLLYLGFVDRGFLSISHLTGALRVGPSLFLQDLPLLLLVAFTVVTTLLWGRVFCGFLCPFGALQDLLERIVPARFRRELPLQIHRRLKLLKYAALGALLLPALAGSSVSGFQYLEPFGTVFYLSASTLLWGIAGGFLLATAVVPRFYCRYVCPLGAALAVGSSASPFRIRRVEQCSVCVVCHGRCPTRAVQGERIDFLECVRCNACETALIERAGSCRHDMSVIKSRLVQVEGRRAGGAAGLP
jgi:polyferredoxin